MTYGEEKMEAQSNLCEDCERLETLENVPTRDLIVELERRNYSGVCLGCRLDAVNSKEKTN